jgi:hypothetical protein
MRIPPPATSPLPLHFPFPEPPPNKPLPPHIAATTKRARLVLSRYVTTLPRSLHYFLDVFLYFLAVTARRLRKRVPQTNCFSPLFLYFLVCGAHVAASHRKVTLLKVAPTTLRKKRLERDIASCCFCIDERSAHSEFMSFVLPPVFSTCVFKVRCL